MSKQEKGDQFNAIMIELAAALKDFVESELPEGKWEVAFIDIRAPADSSGWTHKVRVERLDGSIEKSLTISGEIVSLFMDAWEIKDEAFLEKWYGVKVSVHPDGKFEIAYNQDPNCFEDPSFYDW